MFKILVIISFLAVSFTRSQPVDFDLEDYVENFLGELGERVTDFVEHQLDRIQAMDEKYNLTFFPWTGHAEVIRWILAYADQDFLDNRVSAADWPALKPTTPFGQLPLLQVTRKNGYMFTLAQSKAIASYLAGRFDLDGDTDTEEAFVNMYAQQLGDLFEAYTAALQQNQTQALFNTTWPTNFNNFEKALAATGGKFLIGEEITWADLFLSQITDFLGDKKSSFIANYPNIKDLDSRIRSEPNIAEWIKNRPANNYLWY